MKLDRNETVAGIPIGRVRDFLREIRSRTYPEFQLRNVTEFFDLDPLAAERLLSALLRRRLAKRSRERVEGIRRHFLAAGQPIYEVGSEGVSLSAALLLPSIKRATADRLVAGLLQHANEIATARDDFLMEVTGLAIFGSYRTDASELGDVDVLYDYRWLPEIKALPSDEFSERLWELFERDGRRHNRIGDEGLWPTEKLRRCLRGRSPYIRLHWLSDAKVIKTPVRVIYLMSEGQLTPARDWPVKDFLEAVRSWDPGISDAEYRRGRGNVQEG